MIEAMACFVHPRTARRSIDHEMPADDRRDHALLSHERQWRLRDMTAATKIPPNSKGVHIKTRPKSF